MLSSARACMRVRFLVYNTFFNHFSELHRAVPRFCCGRWTAMFTTACGGVFPLAVAVNLLNNYFFLPVRSFSCFYTFSSSCSRANTGSRRAALDGWRLNPCWAWRWAPLFLWPAVLCLKDNPPRWTFPAASAFCCTAACSSISPFWPRCSSRRTQRLPNIFTDAVVKHTSMTAFLPVVSCAGVWAYKEGTRKSAFTKIMWACLIMALVPVLNSAFLRTQFQLLRTLVLYAHPHHVRGHHAALQGRGDQPDGGPAARGRGNAAVRGIRACPSRRTGVWSLGVVKGSPSSG